MASHKGWMTQHVFSQWFKRHFLRYAQAARPLLLLVDGHSSHYCPDTIRLAMEGDMIIFALPPNTTHITQPLDKGIFGPLKLRWRQVVHDFRISHAQEKVTQYNFCRLFSKARVESMTPVNICSGFKTTGIHPLDPGAMKIPCQVSGDSKYIGDTSEMAVEPYTPAKRQIIKDDSDNDLQEMCVSDSPLVSVTNYKQLERTDTIKMANLDDIPEPTRQESHKEEGDTSVNIHRSTSQEDSDTDVNVRPRTTSRQAAGQRAKRGSGTVQGDKATPSEQSHEDSDTDVNVRPRTSSRQAAGQRAKRGSGTVQGHKATPSGQSHEDSDIDVNAYNKTKSCKALNQRNKCDSAVQPDEFPGLSPGQESHKEESDLPKTSSRHVSQRGKCGSHRQNTVRVKPDEATPSGQQSHEDSGTDVNVRPRTSSRQAAGQRAKRGSGTVQGQKATPSGQSHEDSDTDVNYHPRTRKVVSDSGFGRGNRVRARPTEPTSSEQKSHEESDTVPLHAPKKTGRQRVSARDNRGH